MKKENAMSLSVVDFGAKGDARTDCTAAFQTALNKAAATGGVVSVAPGQYRIDGVLSIPEGVTLEGVWRGPHTSQLDKGSTLLAFANRGKEDAPPFVSLLTGSMLKGLTIYYPEQKVEEIKPYPWTIQGRGQHYNVIDVTIANAYNGIDCGTFHNEGHHLRNVHMCCLRRGLLVDQCSDVGRVENVHIHNVYWWRIPERLNEGQVKMLETYTLANLEGFIIGRTDWEYMSNCFVIWARIGFHFICGKRPVAGAGNVLITQSGSDVGPIAVQVEETCAHAGVAFENSQFMSGVIVDSTNSGPLKFSNCGFWGNSGFWGQPDLGSQMVLNGNGTVTLTGCHFSEWEGTKPCIQANNGSLLMTGCEFWDRFGMMDGTQTHLFLGKDLTSAAIIANRFRDGKTTIVNESKGDVQIIGNVIK